jgi:hypothetical protein
MAQREVLVIITIPLLPSLIGDWLFAENGDYKVDKPKPRNFAGKGEKYENLNC